MSRPVFAGLWERRWLCLLIPPLLGFALHCPILGAELFWDDKALVPGHPRLAEPGFFKEILGRDYGLEFQGEPVGYYRPLLMFINYGVFHAFGPSAPVYHLVILLVFCFSCFALTFVAGHALGERGRGLALIIGIAAAIHPVRTEFASFLMSMPDLLLEIFSILLIALSVGRPAQWPLWPRVVAAAALALAAGLSKETGFFVFGALGGTLLLAGLRAGPGRARLFLGLSTLLGLAGAYALRQQAEVVLPPGNSPLEILQRGVGNGLGAIFQATANLVVPSPTVFLQTGWSLPNGLGIVLLLPLACAVTWLLWRLLSRDQLFEALIAAWLAAGLLSLLLVGASGLHFSARYIPSGAAIIALALLLDRVWRKLPAAKEKADRVPALLLAGYLGALAAFAFVSTVRCQSDVGFFEAMAEDDPKLDYPWIILTKLMLSRYQDIARSDPYFARAIAIAPNSPHVRSLSLTRAVRYIAAGDFHRGLKSLEWGAQVLPQDPHLWYLHAVCQEGLKNLPGALVSIERCLQLAPHQPKYRQKRDEIKRAAGG